MISKEELAREILKRQKLKQRAEDLKRAALSPLSDKQLGFVTDTAKRRVAITSRQSGKTTAALAFLLQQATQPKSRHLYTAATSDGARDPMWERLKHECEDRRIAHEANETRLEMRLTDYGSVIALRGVPDVKQANRLLGRTIDSAVIDESASYPEETLKTLIVKVIEPMLMAKNGKLALIGTPGLQPKGFFYECSVSKAYSQHRWLMNDNPIYGDRVGEIHRDVLSANGWTLDTPTFRREYLGEWCADTEAAVYRVTDRNLCDNLPEGNWRHVIGVDFGYRDEAAFIVVAWRDHDPTLYVVHEDSEQELLVDGYVSRIKQLIKQYNPIAVVGDAGALGKTLTETLLQNHGIPIEAADKRDKPTAIRQVNSDLHKGAIFMRRDGLFEQMSTLRWHPEKIGLLEQPGMPNDRCDAFLYSYRKAWHFLQKPLPPKPVHGSTEYFKRIEEEIREQVRREAEYDPWTADPWS